MPSKKEKKVKAWAVLKNKNGKIITEDFFVREHMRGKASLAIFPKKPINSHSPLWGYAINNEVIIPCEITYKI